MPSRILATQRNGKTLETELQKNIQESGCRSLGIAAAFFSAYGASFLRRIAAIASIDEIRIICDIRDGVTHPSALQIALDEGWKARVVSARSTFHPKMFVGGTKFDGNNRMQEPTLLLVGSGNLTRNGLRFNTECAILRRSDDSIPGASSAFAKLWAHGIELSAERLAGYEGHFARVNRERSARDINSLGVSDEADEVEAPFRTRRAPSASQRAMSPRAATAAWAGLQSFTGEYRLQVEFPRSSGEALGTLLRRLGHGSNIDVLCEDGQIRPMRYRYYEDNSMFRLNVPNETPGVRAARRDHNGVALLQTVEPGSTEMMFSVLSNPRAIADVVERSVALGSWGRTSTREYGWY